MLSGQNNKGLASQARGREGAAGKGRQAPGLPGQRHWPAPLPHCPPSPCSRDPPPASLISSVKCGYNP